MSTLITLLYFILALILCFITHEAGHFMAAGILGEKLKFYFDWDELYGIIPIPTLAFPMPTAFTATQKAVVAISGFGAEIGFAFLLLGAGAGIGGYCAGVALAHFCLYPFYADTENDFNFLLLR